MGDEFNGKRSNWEEYRYHILSELKHLAQEIDRSNEAIQKAQEERKVLIEKYNLKIDLLSLEMERLKTQMKLWIAMGSILFSSVASLITHWLTK